MKPWKALAKLAVVEIEMYKMEMGKVDEKMTCRRCGLDPQRLHRACIALLVVP